MAGISAKDDFFTHLRQHRVFHIIVSGDTDDFDPSVLSDWRNEGFQTTYLPFGNGGAQFVRRLQGTSDQIVGVNEKYAVVSYGSPGAPLLTSLRQLPRLAAIIAYYPPQIPSTQHVIYPPHVAVLLHLCANSTVLISRKPAVLGLQSSKIKTSPKRVSSGAGLGGAITMGQKGLDGGKNVSSFVYEGVVPGFAEADVNAFNSPARELAWSRSLAVARKAFGLPEPDLAGVRDRCFDAQVADPGGKWADVLPDDGVGRVNLPTLTGGFDRDGLRAFYKDLFAPSAHLLRAKLVSRTVGTSQLVDEMIVSFKHDRVVEWILPRVPPTGRWVKIPIVSIIGIKGGKCVSERLYWDQASVLVQIGMLDPALVAGGFKTVDGKKKKDLRMPVVGAEQARAVDEGENWEGSVNELVDGLASL